MEYWAHTSADGTRQQKMITHLQDTAKKAAQFAKDFASEQMAYQCGLLHDIGKYSSAFQQRIRGSTQRVDHSTAGAQTARDLRNIPAAFCIAGHHSGLPDGGSKIDTPQDATFFGKMQRKVGVDIEDYSAYKTELTQEQLSPASIPAHIPNNIQSLFFYTRMLYSCLVDADYLDTEEFMQNEPAPRGGGKSLQQLNDNLTQYIHPWWDAKTELNQKRCHILDALLNAGSRPKGLYSLTVPTGGGKTVSSMAFALRHALANNRRRIIYVIPYTSIIEQTQQVFEEILGAESVIAHYANVEYSTDESGMPTDKRYLATENWDAPIIVTTAVQFFESLYGNRSSRCRKLHNMVNSVIVFDEAQMLPVPYLQPCIASLAQLVNNYGCSAVLCTATQPALAPLLKQYFTDDFCLPELCPGVDELYQFFKRAQYKNVGKISDEALAQWLNAEPQVLCIVNSRKHAQNIYALLEDEGSYHLSTTMYPAHRRKVLCEIRKRLKADMPCRVVSTSLIEAGVDVDFPTVYRALAGLDSIIQAGGRCNREGNRPFAQSMVYVFEAEQSPPQMMLQNIAAAKRVMQNNNDISAPQAITSYFDFLYYTLKDERELDKKQILHEIESTNMPFAAVAEKFRLIEDSGYTVYIPLEEGKELTETLKKGVPTRSLMRKLGQYAVGVYKQHFNQLLQTGAIEIIGQNAGILNDVSLYNNKTGLSFAITYGQENII
ncbi:MAG: CRISPR-associated helicase Cas3' [Oscillospiraceae bacterium]